MSTDSLETTLFTPSVDSVPSLTAMESNDDNDHILTSTDIQTILIVAGIVLGIVFCTCIVTCYRVIRLRQNQEYQSVTVNEQDDKYKKGNNFVESV